MLKFPRMSQSALEPVIPNPKKNLITALCLLVLIVVGGVLVLLAYNNWNNQKFNDDRPAYSKRKITPKTNALLVVQDGNSTSLFVPGTVTLLQCVVSKNLALSAESNRFMLEMSKRFSTNSEVRFVTLVLDPGPAEMSKGVLQAAATKLQASQPKWSVGTTDPEWLLKFIKKELHPSVVPMELNGEWKFDPSIMLIDRKGHIRQAVIPQKTRNEVYIADFDFTQAKAWDDKGIKTGTAQSNVETLERLLEKTVKQLLTESAQ